MASLGRRIHVDTKKLRRGTWIYIYNVMGLLDKSTYITERQKKTDNKPFMQYLFHRIEFSDARKKTQVGGCLFFLLVVPTPNENHRNIVSYVS